MKGGVIVCNARFRDNHMVAMTSTPDQNTGSTGMPLWRQREYRRWWGADTLFAMSSSMAGFALPLVVFTVTRSTGISTTLSAISTVIAGILTLPGGLLQDRVDRRLLLAVQGISGCMLYLAIAIGGTVQALSVPTLAALMVVQGIRSGLVGGTTNTMLRGVVNDEDLPRAMSVNHGRDALIQVLGTPLAGLLTRIGDVVPIWCASACNAGATVCGLLITQYWHHGRPVPQHTASQRTAERHAASMMSKVKNHAADAALGLRWLMRERFLRHNIVASAVTSGCFNALMTMSVLDIVDHGGGALSASLLNVAVGIGMVVGSFVSGALVSTIRTSTVCVLYFGYLCIADFAVTLSPSIMARCAFLLFAMLLLPLGNASFGGFQTTLVSGDAQGRVFAGMGVIEMTSGPLILAVSGQIMQRFGYRTAGIALGVVMVIAVIYWASLRTVLLIPRPGEWASFIKRHGIPQI